MSFGKSNRKYGVIALIAVLMFLLTACGSKGISKSDVENTWKIVSITGADSVGSNEMGQIIAAGGEISMTFSGGEVTMKVSYLGQVQSNVISKYEVKDGKLYLDGDDAHCSIDGNTMTIKDPSGKVTIKLQK